MTALLSAEQMVASTELQLVARLALTKADRTVPMMAVLLAVMKVVKRVACLAASMVASSAAQMVLRKAAMTADVTD